MIRRALPALAFVLTGCGSQAQLLAFTTTRDGNAEVYVMRADGTHLVDLTQNLAQDGEPSWSPDGKRIAFVSARAGLAQIYVMDANGANVRRLTHDQWDDMAPVWSPDQKRIAFMCTAGTPRIVTEICVVGADGRGELRLTRPPGGDNLYPTWSPDSRVIAFTARQGVSEVSASGVRLRTKRDVAELTWAANGATAYLEHPPGGGNWRLDVDGRVVFSGPGSADSPTWAPDGTRVAFVDRHDIYVIDDNGTGLTRVTHGPGNSLSPEWSSDGRWIAFERTHGNRSDIGVVRADGTGERLLTSGPGGNGGPVWRP